MPSVIDRLLSMFTPEYRQLRAEVTALQQQVSTLMVNQGEINQKFDNLTGALAGIRADIDALKAASTPGEPMTQENFDKLSAIADAFAALDDETPEAPAQT